MAKQPDPIYIDRFQAGLYTNRSALAVPQSAHALSVVVHKDALIDGSNMELSPKDTLIRRPGFPKYLNSAFGSSEWPLNFWSGRLAGTLYNLVDTQSNIYQFDSSSKTSIFTKLAAAQSYFQQVGNTLYFSDGTTNKKWDGVTVSNNGIVAPTAAPTVANLNLIDLTNATQTVHAWSPQYTFTGPSSGVNTYFLKDPNGNIQFAFLNPGATAKSGSSQPKWSTTTGGSTVDGDMTWICAGPIGSWLASTGTPTYFSTAYNSGVVQNLNAGPKQPGTATPSGAGTTWSPGTAPGPFGTGILAGSSNSKVLDLTNFNFGVPAAATIAGIKVDVTRQGAYLNIGGTSTIKDVTIQLLKASATTGNNKADTSGIWAAASTTKTYGNNADLWGGTFGPTDINGSGFGLRVTIALAAAGALQGAIATISAVKITVYYTLGSVSNAFSSSVILDSNGNLQRISTLGTTGNAQPTWSTTVGGTTTDNAGGGTMVWQCMGAGNVLAALVGWEYAYGFHTTSSHISTMSPLLSLVAPIIGRGVTLQGVGSADTQCDRNDLYRNADGGALLFYCASDNNIDGSTQWSIFDNKQDVDLDQTLVGPIAHLNDPPPTGLINITHYLGRMWGSIANKLYFSAGPDCTNGDGNQAWPPANVFTLPSNIYGIAPSSQGLCVFTDDSFWVVLGGPQTLSFYIQPVLQNMGILSANCLMQDGDTLYLFTSNRQLIELQFSGKDEIGFAIADQLLAFSPATSSLAIHRNGQDEGLFISDGSASIFRYSLRRTAWSTKATIVGGIGVIKSIETSAGTYTLLAGRPTGSDFILGRSLSSFLDGATTYSGFATIGSLVLSTPGTNHLVRIQNFTLEYTTAGTDLTLSVLPNELSGSFTTIPFNTTDPYQLTASSTVKMRRHDWLGVQSMLPNAVKHLQVKVTLPTENAANELIGFGINPSVQS